MRRGSESRHGRRMMLWLLAGLALFAAHLAAPPRVRALINKLYSIKDVMDESQVIAEGKIESVDAKAMTAVIRVGGNIKGESPFKEIKLHMGFGDPWHPAMMMKCLKADEPALLFFKMRGTYAYNNREKKDEVYCIGYTGGVWFLACGFPREGIGGLSGKVKDDQRDLIKTFGPEAPDLVKQVDAFKKTEEDVFWFFRHIELFFSRTYRGPATELIALVKDAHAGKRPPPPPDPAAPPISLESVKKDDAAAKPRLPAAGPAPDLDWLGGAGWSVQTWGGPAKLVAPQTEDHGRVLRIDFPRDKQDKIALGRRAPADISGARRLIFEAFNTGSAPVKLAWAFKTDALRQYFEAPPVEIPPGSWKYDLETSLAARHFKCRTTNWEPRSPLVTPERVVEFHLLVYEVPAGGGSLSIGRVRLDNGSIFVRALPLSEKNDLSGVAWADYRANGSLRACLCSPDETQVFLNRSGEFADVTEDSGLSAGSRCAAWADFNADGHPDLLTDGFRLFTWTEDGFWDDSKLLGAPPAAPFMALASAAGWLDYNRDGLPDALLADGKDGLRLLENTGQGPERFRDVSEKLGPELHGPGSAKTQSLALADYDGDGFTDVFCAGKGKAFLLHNEGGKGFKIGADLGLEWPQGNEFSGGAAFADFDNDGRLDLFVSGAGKAQLFRNSGGGAFTNVTAAAGDLARIADRVVTAAWGDVNGDGNLDLLLGCPNSPPRLYLGDGKGGFSGPDKASGLEAIESVSGAKALAFADWDGDGDLDLLAAGEQGAAVLVNACPRDPAAGRAPLRVRLPAGACPGAVVRLQNDKAAIIGLRQLGLTQGLSSQEPTEAVFWIQPGAYKLTVTFTNGEAQEKKNTVEATGAVWTVPAQKPEEKK